MGIITAIGLAKIHEKQIIGITCVGGKRKVEDAVTDALLAVKLCHAKIPIYKGFFLFNSRRQEAHHEPLTLPPNIQPVEQLRLHRKTQETGPGRNHQWIGHRADSITIGCEVHCRECVEIQITTFNNNLWAAYKLGHSFSVLAQNQRYWKCVPTGWTVHWSWKCDWKVLCWG